MERLKVILLYFPQIINDNFQNGGKIRKKKTCKISPLHFKKTWYNIKAAVDQTADIWARSSAGRGSGSVIAPQRRGPNSLAGVRFTSHIGLSKKLYKGL